MNELDQKIILREMGLHNRGYPSQASARVSEITERKKLKSADGRTLDKHDQFYRDHKLLLVLFVIMGVMPIQRGEIGKSFVDF